MSVADANRLCLSCALCCDGSLFDAVPLTESESTSTLWKGAVRTDAAPSGKLMLPCPWLDRCRCSVYGERPGTCRAYECVLYTDVATGATLLEAALEEVAATRAVLASMADTLPAHSVGQSFIRRLKEAATYALANPDALDRVPTVLVDYADYESCRERFLPAA